MDAVGVVGAGSWGYKPDSLLFFFFLLFFQMGRKTLYQVNVEPWNSDGNLRGQKYISLQKEIQSW